MPAEFVDKLKSLGNIYPIGPVAEGQGLFLSGGQIIGGTLSGGSIPVGVITMWSGLLASIPAGWALCDGGGGRPDLRSIFIKGAAAGVDPGATGGAATHTPAGTNSAPTFTGSALAGHLHGVGTIAPSAHAGTAVSAHTGAAVDDHPTHDHSGVTGTPSATTPTSLVVGAVASSTHTHTIPSQAVMAHTVTQPSNHTVTQPSDHTMSGSTSSDSAGTPAGTVAAPVFTGTSADYQPAFYSLAFIIKT